MKLALILLTACAALAQEAPRGSNTKEESNRKEGQYERPSEFEVEFVASDIFRSGSYIQPVWRGLAFEGHYFGGTTLDSGFTGVSYTFRIGELKLSPGGGVEFGSNQFATTPAISFRWGYEKNWFVTEGLYLQGFRRTPVFREEEGGKSEAPPEPVSYVRPSITDGDHVSVRWKRVTVGGTWEYIHFREGDEWKGGGRLAVRLFSRVSAVLYVLGPGRAEWRGGILIAPR